MLDKLRILLGQLNFFVGDIKGNLAMMLDTIKRARNEFHADILVFPELALTGYPPDDLLLRQDFNTRVREALSELQQHATGIDVIVGYPEKIGEELFNAAAILRDKKTLAVYHKQCLPNYGIFDEKRYFTKGHEPCIFNVKNIPIAITICEDLWYPEATEQAVAAGARAMICINASPFNIYKLKEREKILRARTQESKIPIIYAHCVGGQDEIIFDGRSMAMDQHSELRLLAPIFEEALIPIDLTLEEFPRIETSSVLPQMQPEAKAYHALVLALKDYCAKNGFKQVLLGLSGGLDSALTLCIAVDAIGAENVEAVLMPSRYTSDMSIEDAQTLANNLQVAHSTISIEPAFEAILSSLKNRFTGTKVDVTEENLQARCRGMILMAIANKFRKLVLSTGNKSEMAVGYATLYGDMVGGFAVLKDVYKTLVYKLAEYRNAINSVIPQRTIDRAPSAELAHGQTDQDTLPPYPILDAILELYVEKDQSPEQIIAAGFDKETVLHIIKITDRNEYKRRQAPPGPKITTRAFGRGRRYPITSGFNKDLS